MITLTYAWVCLACPEHGSGDGADKAADKHSRTVKHSTRSWAVPQSGAALGCDGDVGS